MPDPGRLKDRVMIQQNVPVELDSGFEQEQWQDVKLAWADIQPLTGSELFRAQTLLGATPATITMRFDPVLNLKDTKLRLVDTENGEVWDVEAVQDVGNRHTWLQLLATRLVGGGVS